MPESYWLYLAFGALAGILSGLFGIGGGVVIVPFLAWQFDEQGFNDEIVMVSAVATSLATIVITSLSAVYAHHRRRAVDWPIVGRLSPGILFGSVLGSMVADRLPVPWFKLIFALFLLFIAARILSGGRHEGSMHWNGSNRILVLAGVGIGLVSAILGIGGGTLSVPLLLKCRYAMRNAVAISAACGFPLAMAGTASYLVLGWHHSELPPHAVGYIYVPAFAGIVGTSVLFAPLGARLAHKLPTIRLKRIFSVVLLAVGGKLLWQAVVSSL